MSEQLNSEHAGPKPPTGNSGSCVLLGSRAGLFGLKAGMTQIYDGNGDLVAVTVIDLKPAVVTQVKSQAKDGYSAVQIGMSAKAGHRVTRAEKGHFKKVGSPGFQFVKEIRVDSVDGITEGMLVSPSVFKIGDLVDVTADSKGKGYQGGMKRYNMAGGNKTHGASLSHRSLGSIGNRADPAKTFKNKKMPGQMGNKRVTIQNLHVLDVNAEEGLLLVKGAVPGPKSCVVMVRKAIKRAG